MPDRSSNTSDQRNKKAYGVFPRMSLKDVLELASAVHEIGQGMQVRRLKVFEKLKKSPESGWSRMLVTTAGGGYGLITGNVRSDFLNLTELGKKIFFATSELERREAIHDVLFGNPLFAKFMTDYIQKRLPDDDVAVDYLKTTHQLSDDDAKVCWRVFKSNIVDYDLVRDISGRQTILPRDMALENLPNSQKDAPPYSPRRDEAIHNSKETESDGPSSAIEQSSWQTPKMSPQILFNIQVVLPENASPETYDAIFESIAKHLIGREE